MTKDKFDREMKYQIIMYFVKRMFMEVLITEEEYRKINSFCLDKFKPVTGDLLSGKFLLISEISKNKNREKEKVAKDKEIVVQKITSEICYNNSYGNKIQSG